MVINVNVRLSPFGQIRLEWGKELSPAELPCVTPVPEKPDYGEPRETASKTYELWYQQDQGGYSIPNSTA